MNTYLLNEFNKVEKIHWWWEGRRSLIEMLLNSRKLSKILDIGCGTGETLSFLKNTYPKTKLYGVDILGSAVKFTKSRGLKNIYKTSANKLPFKDNYFDAVLFLDVLEHIKDDDKAIKEAKRVLKKKGVIIITAPGLKFIWSDHDTKQGHYRRYTRRDVKRLAINNKLIPVCVGYFNFFFCLPISVIRLLSKIKIFKNLSDYDRGINYDIANATSANKLLKFIFVNEIRLLRYIRYPIGVSVVAKLVK